jgi:hypothetical protein
MAEPANNQMGISPTLLPHKTQQAATPGTARTSAIGYQIAR